MELLFVADSAMVDTRHYTLPKLTGHTTRTVEADVNYELRVMMTCQCRCVTVTSGPLWCTVWIVGEMGGV